MTATRAPALRGLVATARPRLVVPLWALAAACATLFTLPVGGVASALLDRRTVGEALVRGDDGVLLELLFRHAPFILAALRTSLLGGLVVYLVASWVTAGGVLAWLARARSLGDTAAPSVGGTAANGLGDTGAPSAGGTAAAPSVGDTGAPSLVAEAGRVAWRMVRVGFAGLVVEGGLVAVAGGVAYGLMRAAEPRGYDALRYVAPLAAVTVLLALGGARTVLHAAQAVAFAPAEGARVSAWRSVGRAFVVLARRPGAALGLVALATLGWLLPTLAAAALSARLDAWPTRGFIAVGVARHLSVALRAWCDAALLAGAATVVADADAGAASAAGAPADHRVASE